MCSGSSEDGEVEGSWGASQLCDVQQMTHVTCLCDDMNREVIQVEHAETTVNKQIVP